MKRILMVTLVAITVLVFGTSGVFAGGGRARPAEGYRDTVIWAQAADITNIDPHIGREAVAIQVFTHIYDTLTFRCPATQEILPSIATRWEQLSPTSWRFFIREGVRFHDGTFLSGYDVQFSLERALRTPAVAAFSDWISTVTVESRYVVRIDTRFPYAAILRQLSMPVLAMLPRHLVEPNNDILLTQPTGTGPFRFVHWRHGVEAELVAFDDHWRGPPATRRLIMRVIPEALQRVIALETGEVDIIYDVHPSMVRRLQVNPNFVVHNLPSFSYFHVLGNVTRPPFNNPLVRRAISHAIDRELLAETIMEGFATPADSPITPTVFGYHSTGIHRFDPAYSRQLLAQAGFPNGFTTSFYVSPHPERVEVAQAVTEMLRNVGIDARLEIIEFGTLISRLNAGDFAFAKMVWTTVIGDADYTFFMNSHSSQHGVGGNFARFSNARVDDLIMRGRSTANEAERLAIYRELTEVLQHYVPQIPIFWPDILVGTSARVSGFNPDPAWYHWHFYTRVRN